MPRWPALTFLASAETDGHAVAAGRDALDGHAFRRLVEIQVGVVGHRPERNGELHPGRASGGQPQPLLGLQPPPRVGITALVDGNEPLPGRHQLVIGEGLQHVFGGHGRAGYAAAFDQGPALQCQGQRFVCGRGRERDRQPHLLFMGRQKRGVQGKSGRRTLVGPG